MVQFEINTKLFVSHLVQGMNGIAFKYVSFWT